MSSRHGHDPSLSNRRDGHEILQRQARITRDAPHIHELYNSVNDLIFILNGKRQIVFMNKACEAFLDQADLESLHGLRYGEVMACTHARETPEGCGSSSYCPTCGAFQAIRAAHRDSSSVGEFRLSSASPSHTGEFVVRSTQLDLSEETFTVLALRDISDEKRRHALERIFFHDILNTAAGVKGLAEVFQMMEGERQRLFSQKIKLGANRLVDEINSHRLLTAAERNELRCNNADINSIAFLEEIIGLYEGEASSKHQRLLVTPDSVETILRSDPGLLSRVLGNMVKNALEASPPHCDILLICHVDGTRIRFYVENPGVIAPEVAQQMFTRSFSTKGEGRGLGTWAMKLLGESYLGGTLSFHCILERGMTRFVADFPLTPSL